VPSRDALGVAHLVPKVGDALRISQLRIPVRSTRLAQYPVRCCAFRHISSWRHMAPTSPVTKGISNCVGTHDCVLRGIGRLAGIELSRTEACTCVRGMAIFDCPWGAGNVVTSPHWAGTWMCCSGRESTAANGTQGDVEFASRHHPAIGRFRYIASRVER
jgi:hypothetical protein